MNEDEQENVSREEAHREWLAFKNINKEARVDSIEDINPIPIDCLKPGLWYLWSVNVKFKDGTFHTGSIQGDGFDLWAFETFEEEP